MLTGCISGNWHARDGDLVAGCDEGAQFDYFLDADRDGWGQPYVGSGDSRELAPSVAACSTAEATTLMAELLDVDVESIAVAANNRDCFDAVADDPVEDPDGVAVKITGRIGSICPEQLVANDGQNYFTPLSAGGVEIVIVHDEPVALSNAELTPLTWGDAAADACGPWGWGGGNMFPRFSDADDEALGSLLSLVGQSNLQSELTTALPSNIDAYAGFVGVVSHTLTPAEGDSGWFWESVDADGVPSFTAVDGELPYCPAGEPDADEYSRLAAVFDRDAEDQWCLGLPSDAPTSVERYDTRFGHFICQRAIPDGTLYAGTSDYGIDAE